jgi:hypothetical protein
MNLNYTIIIKQDFDKLLVAEFIELMEQAIWLSRIMVVLKQNGKLQICIDFQNLNAATKNDPYPLPFMDEVLDKVIGHQVYSFLDGFSDYH